MVSTPPKEYGALTSELRDDGLGKMVKEDFRSMPPEFNSQRYKGTKKQKNTAKQQGKRLMYKIQ